MEGVTQVLLDGLTVAAGTAVAIAFVLAYWRNSTRLKGCLFTLLVSVGLLLSGLLGVMDATQRDTEGMLALTFAVAAAQLLLQIAFVTLAIVVIVVALVPAIRPFGLILLQRFLRWPEARDFAAARAATGKPGNVLREAGLTVWTDIDPSRHASFSTTLGRMVKATAGATGLRLDNRRSLRVLAFNDGGGSQAYAGRLGEVFRRAGGYHMHLPRPIVLVHREAVEIIRPNLDWVLAHEYAHYLTIGAMGPIREIWLSEGLAMYLPSLALSTHPRSVRPTRMLQAAIQRGDMPPPKTFLSANYLRLKGLDTQSEQGNKRAEAAGQIALYYFMSGAFVRYLHRRDAAAFQRFLRGYRRAGASKRHFKSCFGVRPEQALQDHIDHILASKAPPIRVPLPEKALKFEREVIAPLRDPATPLDRRLEMLGIYGLNASAWHIDIVIDQLAAAELGRFRASGSNVQIEAEDGALIHAGAQRALENVAGTRIAQDAPGWRAWARGLSPDLVGPTSE
jgi:signal transduction histidine kinase